MSFCEVEPAYFMGMVTHQTIGVPNNKRVNLIGERVGQAVEICGFVFIVFEHVFSIVVPPHSVEDAGLVQCLSSWDSHVVENRQ